MSFGNARARFGERGVSKAKRSRRTWSGREPTNSAAGSPRTFASPRPGSRGFSAVTVAIERDFAMAIHGCMSEPFFRQSRLTLVSTPIDFQPRPAAAKSLQILINKPAAVHTQLFQPR